MIPSICTFLVLALGQQEVPSSPAAIVVRPAAWAEALSDWKVYRTGQGHRIIELDAELGQAVLHTTIVRLVRETEVRRRVDPSISPVGFVVLVGDADRGPNLKPPLPTWYRPSTALVQFGGDKELATDNPYGDVDGDEIPDLAVGRVPADSFDAAKQFFARTMAYEKQASIGSSRRDVRVVAGVGGFGAIADALIEMTTRSFLTERVPKWANVSMTYASPNSPFCPDPWHFCESTIDQLNAGSLFWIYVGHGHVKHLDYLKVGSDFIGILDDSQVAQVRVQGHRPIAIFLACYTGAFDAREDCLAEQLVMGDNGAVAALAATRVSGPYGLAALSSNLLDQCFEKRIGSLGEVIRNAKRQMLVPSDSAPDQANDSQMEMITAIAAALNPVGYDLSAERQEHVWQMNLLGDPMLRINHPSAMNLSVSSRVIAGETIMTEGTCSHPGRLTVELTRSRDRAPRDLFVAGQFSSDSVIREKMQASYGLANNYTLQRQTIELAAAGAFQCQFPTSLTEIPGRYVVKVFAEGNHLWSTASTDVLVRLPRTPSP